MVVLFAMNNTHVFDLMYKIRNDNDSGKGFIHGFNQEKGWLSNMNCSTKPANMGTITG